MQTSRHAAILVAVLMGTVTGCKEDDDGDTGSTPLPTDDTGSTGGAGTTDDTGSADDLGETTLVEEEGEKDCSVCGNPLCNSDLIANECYCRAGYEWKNPADPDDFECVRMEGKGGSSCPDPNSVRVEAQCFCVEGYAWCNPHDDADLSCCVADDDETGTG